MMEWTDRHCRAFHRGLTRRARLYTEMIAARAVIHGDRARLLAFDPAERPLALQLGGSEPAVLAQAARIGEEAGFEEINLNCGCPSEKVQGGCFGAVLMREPERVAESLAAMGAAVAIPVTVKCRLGVDDQDPAESLFGFADLAAAAGARTIIVHARKAWLKGLSPKENREIPPLDHGLVHALKRQRPDLEVVVNGGIETLEQAEAHLRCVDGVMLGRAAYKRPGLLGEADARLFGEGSTVSEIEAVEAYRAHLERELARGTPLRVLIRPMLGLFSGKSGAAEWRRILSEGAGGPGAGIPLVERALPAVGATPRRGQPAHEPALMA